MDIKNVFGEIAYLVRRITLKQYLFSLLVFVAAGGTLGSYVFYAKYQAARANPNLEDEKETAALVSVVGKLIELPKDETPTVATILDKDKLKDQAFFRSGENGDKLLAYTKNRIAILYRPAANKIINVAPITINDQPGSTSSAPSSAASLRIAYYNGAETPGLATAAEKTVREKYHDYQTDSVTVAARRDYVGTLIVDLSGKHGKEAGELALLLGGKVGSLPRGEVTPEADMLIISGK